MRKTTAATTRVYGDALSSQSGFLQLRRAHRSTERGEVIPLDRTRTLHRRRKLGRQRPERANVLRPPLHPGKFVRAANKKLPGLNNQAGVEFVRRRPRSSAIPGLVGGRRLVRSEGIDHERRRLTRKRQSRCFRRGCAALLLCRRGVAARRLAMPARAQQPTM